MIYLSIHVYLYQFYRIRYFDHTLEQVNYRLKQLPKYSNQEA